MLADWAPIASAVVDFCEAHGTAQPELANVPGTLPMWAAGVLGHMASRARQEGRDGAQPVDLTSLLTLLRLTRRYRPRPAPDSRFFTWVARQLVLHREAGLESEEVLAEAVSELVPRLPETERGQLARLLVASQRAVAQTATSPLMEVGSSAAVDVSVSAKFLKSASSQAQATQSGVKLAQARSSSDAWEAALAQRSLGKASGQLWGLLSEPSPSASSLPADGPARVPMQPLQVSAAAQTEQQQAVLHVAAAPEVSDSVQATAKPERDMDELRIQLEQALDRVGKMEAKLEARLLSQESSPQSSSSSSRQSRSEPEPDETMDLAPETPSPFGGFAGSAPSLGSTAFHGGLAGTATSSAQTAQLYLHRPFNFEAFRRANSQQWQAERHRVLVPPDHFPTFPLWPLPQKLK